MQNQITRSHKRDRHRDIIFLTRFDDVSTSSEHDYGHSFPKSAATLASKHHRAAAHTSRQVVSQLHGSALIFMGPRDTKYGPNYIHNLPNYNSSPIVIKLYTYSTQNPTNSILANMNATLKSSMLEPSCTGLESSPFAAHLEQSDDANPAASPTFKQNTTTVAISSMTLPQRFSSSCIGVYLTSLQS